MLRAGMTRHVQLLLPETDKCANVWFCSIDILQRIDDSDVITLSLSRAVLRFCSRAVCSNSWALALTGLRTDIEQVTSILNSIRRTHTHTYSKGTKA